MNFLFALIFIPDTDTSTTILAGTSIFYSFLCTMFFAYEGVVGLSEAQIRT